MQLKIASARSAFAGRSGAERSEEIANGEGVASGGAILKIKTPSSLVPIFPVLYLWCHNSLQSEYGSIHFHDW